MPTPLVHLYIGQHVLETPDRPVALRACAGDYLLGSVAPDSWSISLLSRQEAHMLPIPVPDDGCGADELLRAYPELLRPERLEPAEAAFTAGYMAHLLVDEIWFRQIFEPYFSAGDRGPALRRRLVLHNALRIDMEDRLEERIRAESVLELAHSRGSYPLAHFASLSLVAWRDLLASELHPGALRRSVAVFAQRLNVPSEEFQDLLDSPAAMQEQVFSRLPVGLVEQVLDDAIQQAISLTVRYLSGAFDSLCA